MGTAGVGRALGDVNVFRLPIIIQELPPALNGLKILHLFDLYLQTFSNLNIENILTRAAEHEPDLVVITGDICDDLTLLPDTLDVIAQLESLLGVCACLGNHGYFRRIKQVRRIHDASAVPLYFGAGHWFPFRLGCPPEAPIIELQRV
ncbi:MAG: hypothetical protein DRP47_06415 [Candidatus Zixiibacteriota bacterium]|nr:MAG: hypothetical protein DRP47_06415 [candidate division Zixibacteria bacterium]